MKSLQNTLSHKYRIVMIFMYLHLEINHQYNSEFTTKDNIKR